MSGITVPCGTRKSMMKPAAACGREREVEGRVLDRSEGERPILPAPVESVPALPDVVNLGTYMDPASHIIVSCERVKSWLAGILDEGRIEEILAVKSRAESLCAYAKQKKLGDNADFAAAEIVRRAERCVGLAIRKGQKEGRINKKSQILYPCPGDTAAGTGRIRVSDFGLSRSDLATSIYPLVDGVSDSQFEGAIQDARDERNLSRANVIRRVKGPRGRDRWDQLADLAVAGYTSHQIAEKLEVHRSTVKKKAAERGIEIRADCVMSRSRSLKSDRVLREFVDTLESLAPSCELINITSLSPKVVRECVPIMVDSMKTLRRLERCLKEILDA